MNIFLSLVACALKLLVVDGAKIHASGEHCKVTPNSPFWPSLSDWAELNSTLGGALLRPEAPAAACHPQEVSFNIQACTKLNESWDSSQWHSDNPTSSLWQNVNNYSCLPDSKYPCTTAGYPVYVVNASTSGHVQSAVNFARERKLRLNIKSTGHDFLGRSVQPKSLSIWTHYLRGMKWYDSSFQPQGCNFTINTAAVTAGSGTQFRELYNAGATRKLMLVGGSSHTVSVGGYLTGGGHSPLSPLLGMGADQVLQLEILTADGKLLVANECKNTDLFWAVRGGGPVFGVVTSFTIKAFPSVPVAAWNGTISGSQSPSQNWEAIAYLHQQWPLKLSPLGISGYLTGTPYLLNTPIQLSMTYPNASSNSSLQSLLDPIFTRMSALANGTVTMEGKYGFYPSYALASVSVWNASKDDSKEFQGNGLSKLITSWLYDTAALQSPNLKNALMNSIDNETLMFQDFTAGPGTWNPPFGIRGGSNAINPAWRSAIVRPAAEGHWVGLDRAKLAERVETFKRFGKALRDIAPNMGAYPNEADVNTPDAQRAFFGSNLPRLLSIKKKVDPYGLFWCKTCVGSEMWTETESGELCLIGSDKSENDEEY